MSDTFQSYQGAVEDASSQELSRRYTYAEVDDLIAKPPARILRSGITMIAGFVVIAMVMSWVLRYPDVIEAPVVLTSTHGPVDMIMKSSGVIDSIRIQSGISVATGDTLMYVKSTAKTKDVIAWSRIIEDLAHTANTSWLLSLEIRDNLSLGELQQGYRDIAEQVTQYQNLFARTDVVIQTRQMHKEISTMHDQNASHRRQIVLFEEELSLQEAEFNRAEVLHGEKVISTTEYERARSILLQSKRQHEGMQSVILLNETRIAQLESQILDIEAARQYELATAELKIQESLKTISAGIREWAERYLIISPISGIVTIPGAIREETFVATGQVLCTVVPGHNTQEVYAHLNLPGFRAGKVQPGQRTIIRLDAWPYKEYGSLETKIGTVASVPTMNAEGIAGYEVKLKLTDPLTTSYGVTLPYQPRSAGMARIITEDRRVFHRIFDSLISLLKNK